MLSVSQREKIVKSYSKVLTDIILSHQDAKQYFLDVKNVCSELINKTLCVNPMNIAEYKKLIDSIKQSICNDDELQKFIFLVLKRKYGTLISEIVNQTEYCISKLLATNNVVVNSRNELSNDVKQHIGEIITKNCNGTQVNIRYKTNVNMQENDIEIISNGKICVLDVKNAVKEVLLKN